jgi:Restriction endonuclease
MFGLLAIDLSVTWGTRLYTKPFRSRLRSCIGVVSFEAVGSDGGPSGDSKVRWRFVRTARDKGIFITPSDVSRDANDYVSKIGSMIVLIDGSKLAELMFEFGVADATDATYTVETDRQ